VTAQTIGTVVVIGQGYVGLPLSMGAVQAGYDVVGLDVNVERVRRLNDGVSYVEDISDAAVKAALATGRFRASNDYSDAEGFDIAVVTVPTPLREGSPDLSYIEDSVRSLAVKLRSGATVILESTTYPGTTEELVGPLLEAGSGLRVGTDFHLGYSPERIDPGNPRFGLANTPKVVSGVDAASLGAVRGFYDRLVDQTVPVSSPAVAETTKLLENTFRHVNIALVNELAMFACDLGIDVWEAIEAASSKPFGFMAFRPGPGVGGHCLPIDPSYLSWRVKRRLGANFRFVELANDVNEHMPDYVARRLTAAFNRQGRAVKASRILLLGLAYKADTGDARESPATVVADRLLDLGAQITAADPFVDDTHIDPRIVRVADPVAEAARSDAVVLLVDHSAFDLEAISAASAYLFDTRHRVTPGAHVEYL
jgi:nucleotide sugar dehydrogenase